MRALDELEIEFVLACPPSAAFGKPRLSATARETAAKAQTSPAESTNSYVYFRAITGSAPMTEIGALC